jgi:hypothetical protein
MKRPALLQFASFVRFRILETVLFPLVLSFCICTVIHQWACATCLASGRVRLLVLLAKMSRQIALAVSKEVINPCPKRASSEGKYIPARKTSLADTTPFRRVRNKLVSLSHVLSAS